MGTIRIELSSYYYDLSDKHEAAQYTALCEELKKRGLQKFSAIPNRQTETNKNGPREVETGFLFNNQSNTTCLERVFDWYEQYMTTSQNKNIRRGYYIKKGFEELQEARKNQSICGYCGARYEAKGAPTFCTQCLNSPYIGPDDLPLSRINTLFEGDKRPDLTEEERAFLMPLFLAGQTKAKGKAKARKLKEITENYNTAIDKAETEYQGFQWLLDRDINTDNCIFYDHKKTFCFGWRNGLTEEIKKELEGKLEHFPFNHEFKEA